MKPVRIQLSRKKGWRLPPNTVKVARPAAWGNPFRVGSIDQQTGESILDRAHAVRLFRERWFEGDDPAWKDVMRDAAIDELRGKNLACWCPLDKPCHADVLLEIANQPGRCTSVSITLPEGIQDGDLLMIGERVYNLDDMLGPERLRNRTGKS